MALSVEDLEKALIRADSLAEQGDKQAYEDARILAKEYARRKEEASIKERVGGANPLVDPARSDTLLGKTKAALNFVPAFVEGNVRGAAGLIGQIGGGALGGVEALGRMAVGQGADKAVEEGIKTMTAGSEKARNLFGVLPKDDIFGGARAIEDAFGEVIGKGVDMAGRGSEQWSKVDPTLAPFRALGSPEANQAISNLSRTGGEAVANAAMLGAAVSPLGGMRQRQIRARETARGEAERQRVLEEQASQQAAQEAERIKILEQRSTQGGEVPYAQTAPEPYLGPDVPNKVPRGRNVPEIAEDIIGDRPMGRTYDDVPEGRLPGYTRRDADVPIDDSAAPPRSREGGEPLPYEQTPPPRGDQAFPDPRTRDLAASEADVARARQETQGLLDDSRLPFERTAIPEPDQGMPPGVRRNARGERAIDFEPMAGEDIASRAIAGERAALERQRRITEAEGIPFEAQPNWREAVRRAEEQAARASEVVATIGSKDPAWAPFQAYGRVVEQMARGVSDAAQLIRVLANDRSLNVIERSVARMVSKALEGAGVRMEIVSNADMGRIVPDAVKRLGDTPAGLWQSTEGRILLNQQKPLTHRDLLHEGIHAVLADWQKVFPNSMESRAIRKTYDIARRELTKTRSWDDILRDPDMYGMTNEREFVAEVMSNQAFREKLDKILLSPADKMHLNALMSQIKSGNKHFSPIRTAWDAFVRTVNTLLGREVPDHALSKVAFEAGSTAVKSIGRAETLKDVRQMFRNGDVVTDHLNAMIDRASKTTEQPKVGRSSAKSIIDASVGETRPLEQFMKDIGGKIADLPDNFSNLWIKGLRNLSDITQVYRATGNPFLKYVYEFASNARHEAQLRAEIAKEGTYFSVGKRNPQKLTDPNAPIPRMSVLRRTSPAQYQKMVDIWNEFGGKSKPSRDEMLARGLTTSTIDTIEAVHKSLQSAWKDLNAQRVALGKEPIPEIPFYHPVYFGEGSWMARIRGKDGSTMWFHRFHSKAEADQAAAMFNQKLREKGVTDGVIQPTARMDRELRGSKYNISPVVLEDILSVMEAGDKRRKVINDLVAEIKGKGGFGSHFAKRQGVKGGDLTTKNIQRVYEEYMDGLYNYMGNMEISKLKRDISIMANQETLPRGIAAYAIDYLDRTRGVNTGAFKATEGFLNDLWEGIGGTRLPGNPDIRRAIDVLNKMFMVTKLMIANPAFTIGNMFQYATFGHANLLHMKNLGFNKGSATKSYYKGLHDMFQKEGDFAKYRDEYAVPRGSIDPSFMQEEFGMNNKVSIGKFEVDLKQLSDWGLLMIAPRKAEQLSRLQAHAAAFDFAKDNGFKGKELYSTAETIANSIMVDYNKAARPKVLDDLGVVGVASKPLWTFANYYWSTLGTFTRDAVQGMASGNFAKAAPLASLMVTTTLYAGLTGSVAWHVIDKIWDFLRTTAVIKKAFPEGSRVSFTEWMLSNMPDTVLFGALDSATKLVDPRGMHIAGGLASPEPKIPGLLGGSESPFSEKPMQWAPGIQHALDMSEALYSAFMDAVGAKDYTSAEIRKKLKAPAPSSWGRFFDLLDFQSFSEAQWRDEGMPRPSASPRGYAGPVTDQDTFERGIHVAFGNTLRQEKELMAFREAKEFSGELSEDRQKIVDLMVDNIMFGKGDWDKYVEKAIQLGYKPSELRTALREAYKARVLEEDVRRQGRGGSTARNEETRRRLEMQQ